MASVGQLKEQIATNRNYERLQSRIKQRSKYKFYFSTPIAQLFGYFWPAQVVHTALLQQFLMLIIDINKQEYPSIHRFACVCRKNSPCEFYRRDGTNLEIYIPQKLNSPFYAVFQKRKHRNLLRNLTANSRTEKKNCFLTVTQRKPKGNSVNLKALYGWKTKAR